MVAPHSHPTYQALFFPHTVILRQPFIPTCSHQRNSCPLHITKPSIPIGVTRAPIGPFNHFLMSHLKKDNSATGQCFGEGEPYMPYLPFVYSLILGHPSNRQLTSSLTTFPHLYGCLSCSVSISPYHATTNIQYRLGSVDAFQPTNALQYIFPGISAFFHANIQYHCGPHSEEAVLDAITHPLLSLTKAVTQLPMLNWFQ